MEHSNTYKSKTKPPKNQDEELLRLQKECKEDLQLFALQKRINASLSKVPIFKIKNGADADNYINQVLQDISEQELNDALKLKVDRLINCWEPLLDELTLFDDALKAEKDRNYNVHESLTCSPEKAKYNRILIASIVNLMVLRRGILINLVNLKEGDFTKRSIAVVAAAARRDELKVLLDQLKSIGVAVEMKSIERWIFEVDRIVADQMNFTLV